MKEETILGKLYDLGYRDYEVFVDEDNESPTWWEIELSCKDAERLEDIHNKFVPSMNSFTDKTALEEFLSSLENLTELDKAHFIMPDVSNYYGGLEVKVEEGKYYWGIEDCDKTRFKEIPESLYLELYKHFKGEVL